MDRKIRQKNQEGNRDPEQRYNQLDQETFIEFLTHNSRWTFLSDALKTLSRSNFCELMKKIPINFKGLKLWNIC